MKDRIRSLVSANRSTVENRRLVREYLQHYLLYLLFRTKHYRRLVFTGGTALRILFDLPRFSEDLDFSLAEDAGELGFEGLRLDLLGELEQSGYQVRDKPDERRAVVSTFIRFPGLLHELGLSPHRDEALSVKIEVDKNPPRGGGTRVGLVNVYHLMCQVVHYDPATLLAGKLHALCFRPYTKGRDLYDLMWFLSSRRGLEPNLEFLNNAAAQTEESPPLFRPDNWRSLVRERLEDAAIDQAREQVRPFLERPEEADLLTRENLLGLLAG